MSYDIAKGVEKMTEKDKQLYLELGTTGLRRQGGRIQETYLRELTGDTGRKMRKRMAETDATFGAILFAIEQIVRSAPWSIEERGDGKGAQEAAEFLDSCMTDMSHSWESFISEVLSFLTMGWQWNEICWKKRQGEQPEDPNILPEKRLPSSKYNDGLIGIRKLPTRAQDTLFRWEFDTTGGLQGFWQSAPPSYTPTLIPIQKSLLFRTKAHKGNPEGRSILDSAYTSYYSGNHLEEVLLVGVERDLVGYPYIRLPAPILMDSDKAAQLQKYEDLIKNIRRDEQEGALLPYDPDYPEAYELKLLSTGGRRQFNVLELIQHFNLQKMQTVLADAILIGHENVGSWALYTGKLGMFEVAVMGWLDSIKGVLNAHLVTRLMKLNAAAFPGLEEYPVITYAMPKVPALKDVVEMVKALATAGADLFPNAELMNALLSRVGLPEMSEEELEKASAGLDWIEK